MADETMTVPRNGRLAAKLGEWAQTGVVVVTVLVSGIRWTNSVDSRLGAIEDKVAGQHALLEGAVTETQRNAGAATQAAERAETAVARAETAVTRAETAVAQNQAQQEKMIHATTETRKATETQTKRVTDLKSEVEAFGWRIRMLEEQNRKVLDKKGKED